MHSSRGYLSGRGGVVRTTAAGPVQAGPKRGGAIQGPRSRSQRGERGATSIAVALSSAVVVTVSAVMLDVGQLLVTKAELQMVADLAARSGTHELARVYMSAGRQDPTSDTLTASELEQVRAAAQRRSVRNSAGAVAITVASSDIRIGKWEDATGRFIDTNVGVAHQRYPLSPQGHGRLPGRHREGLVRDARVAVQHGQPHHVLSDGHERQLRGLAHVRPGSGQRVGPQAHPERSTAGDLREPRDRRREHELHLQRRRRR